MMTTTVNLFDVVPARTIQASCRQGTVETKTGPFNLALIILKLTRVTIRNLQSNNYSFFDPLMGNAGCQLAALSVFNLLNDRETRRNLDDIYMAAKTLQKQLLTLASAKKRVKTAIRLEIDNNNLALLVRYALLSQAKILKEENDDENLETSVAPLETLFKKFAKQDVEGNLLDPIKSIQKDERVKAVGSIASLALKLCGTSFSATSIDEKLMCTSKLVERLRPTLSTDLIFDSFEGILMIKNKLQYMNRNIENAEDINYFFQMPGFIQVPLSSVPQQDDMPIMVMECYINDRVTLQNIINEGRIRPFILSCAAQDELVDEERKKLTLTPARKLELDVIKRSSGFIDPSIVLKIDHFFCNSRVEALPPKRAAA